MHLYALDTVNKHWARRSLIDAYAGCDSFICSVKFNATGEQIVTAMYASDQNSAVKTFSVENGLSFLKINAIVIRHRFSSLQSQSREALRVLLHLLEHKSQSDLRCHKARHCAA